MTSLTEKISALAIAAMLSAALGAGSAYAGDHGSSPIVNTIHPIVHHPVHGPGSSHNPIVMPPRDCDDPDTLCRRPLHPDVSGNSTGRRQYRPVVMVRAWQ
jgi:hypothetical protein